ncbi:hypothetical protein ATANTOWER_000540 [Ataeniobius toweri]|uniref:Bcl-2 Bcl-2 homology region 1-3 domain-containing protein n=3 Tax=Goodeidae TaxID=28758 RepID=A0ABU7A9H7_9TELE|nr:hypothetical protein [Ataeniobius toweri]
MGQEGQRGTFLSEKRDFLFSGGVVLMMSSFDQIGIVGDLRGINNTRQFSLLLLKPCRGDELEFLRPSVYRNVARQLNITVAIEGVVSDAFMAVAADIFSTGVTWGKVVSLYAVAGALAVDCVRHGHPAMVHTIVDCMGEFVRKSLTPWLKKRGGWADITKCVVNTGPTVYSHWLVSAVFAFGHYLKAVVLYLLREK